MAAPTLARTRAEWAACAASSGGRLWTSAARVIFLYWMMTQERTPLPLHGRTALVTGAARRVGAEIVRHLHAAGANVVIHCHRSRVEAAALAASLESERAHSTLVTTCDLLDTAALPGLVEATVARFGSLDVLVNNASTFYPTPFGSITPAQWTDLSGTNLQAPLFLAQAAAPALRRAHGLIVNIVDIHGQRPLRNFLVYSAAKAGLIMLTRALARELAPEVRVNAVAPGPSCGEGRLTAAEERRRQRTLLKRAGEPADIAGQCAGAEAPMSPAVLAVDGGRSVGW
jgi:pteridine reductase